MQDRTCRPSELGALLVEHERRMAEALREAQLPAAEAGLRAMLPNVPVRTGALRASGRVEGTAEEPAIVFGGPDAPYAALVEVGTRTQAPAGYMQSSLPVLGEVLGEEIKRRLP